MRFTLLSGIEATPIFAEIVVRKVLTLTNGTSRPVVNVYNFRQTTTPVLGVLATLAASFKTALETALLDCLHTSYTGATVKAKWLDASYFDYADQTAWGAGTVTGERMPLLNTLFTELRTGYAGRNYKGSKHFAPLGEADSNGDDFIAGAITRHDALDAALIQCAGLDGGNSSEWALTVISPSLSDYSADPRLFSGADVTDPVSSPRVGSMLRRKERAGVA